MNSIVNTYSNTHKNYNLTHTANITNTTDQTNEYPKLIQFPNFIKETKSIQKTNPQDLNTPTDHMEAKENIEKYTNQKGHIPVQPLVGENIQRVKDYILKRPQRYHKAGIDFNLRDFVIFTCGINFGLRIGDMLHLKISDVFEDNQIRDYIAIKEQKTKNSKKPAREIFFVPEVKELIMSYITSMDGWQSDWYLFHAVWPNRTPYKSLTRQTVWHQMKKIEEEINSNVPLGTHSLRKTFARALYDMLSPTDPMAILIIQDILGHSSPEITLAYIGITREKKIDFRMKCGMI